MRMRSFTTLLAVTAPLALALLCAPGVARAESGVLNLHLDLGGGLTIAGDMLQEDPVTMESKLPFGAFGTVGLDWQFAQPFALELIIGGGYVFAGFPDTTDSGTPYVTAAIGPRIRFMDNMEGYGDEEGGDYEGNAWVSGHIGYHMFDGSQIGLDIGGGYEWSVMKPIQIGLFVRAALLIGNDNDMRDRLDAQLYGGVSFSFELIGGLGGLDTDGDGLPDERETNLHRTNPNMPDTDGDGLNDGLEVRTRTDPLSSDSDSDGLVDGQEDADHSGGLDAGETDPRVLDTDQGCAPDGWEVQNSKNPRDPADDDSDGDGVCENVDRCPDTPRGEEIDANGCIVMRARITLDGIQFDFNSADILPASEQTLTRALAILRDNPEARVEVAGHTDNVGNAAYNRRLSTQRAASVKQWLVDHGIEAGRMTTRGYGHTDPVAPNETDEGRAQNRRIEFRQIEE